MTSIPNGKSVTPKSEDQHSCVVFKVMLIGDSGVGKTCLLVRFAEGSFLKGSYISTVGIDYKSKAVDVDGCKVKLQIWDTAGQERFRSITHAYYRDAKALFLLYDITNFQSFENVRSWISDIRLYSPDDALIMLIGNKADVDKSEREVPTQLGQRLATEHKIYFMETSAKTGLNVDLAFHAIARELRKLHKESNDDSELFDLNDFIEISHISTKPTKGGCCLSK